jgi:amino acid transporter
LWPAAKQLGIWLTIAPIVALSALNALGIIAGKVTQNVLTAAKVAGLGGLIVAALLATTSAERPAETLTAVGPANLADAEASTNFGLALVFILYAYGGWNHAAYVAAEVRDQHRNLPRALMLGIAGIVLIYLAVNAAYLAALGFARARETITPAADVLELAGGAWGASAMSILVMLSALGAINGMILTGTRIYAEWGADYPALSWLAAWNPRTAAPVAAIALQGAVATLLVILVGTMTGRNTFDSALSAIGVSVLPWEKFPGGFEMLVAGSAPVYWGLCLLTGVAVFVLRHRDARRERPFLVPFFPLPAIAFCATCAFMVHASLDYARWLSLIGFVPLAVGGVVWLLLSSAAPKS